MNYIKHLSGFFDKVSKDDRLNPTHVSLYVSLFQFWNACRFHNPISISRNEAMKVSKINSKATYHKCMRELNEFGYLSYHPSYNPFKGSLVYLFNFQAGVNKVDKQPKIETGSELVLNSSHTKNETSIEQALVSYTNNINNTKQQTRVNSLAQKKSYGKNSKGSQTGSAEYASTKEKIPGAGVEETGLASGQERPLREEVNAYFIEMQWPSQEADKFFNHYESNGWLVGGKSPMLNWQASAEKWMSNVKDFSHSVRNRKSDKEVILSTNKDYSEPL